MKPLDDDLRKQAVPDGSMRYFAWLFTDTLHRTDIAALFLLDSELRNTARANHEVAHVRLQWWKNELTQPGLEPQHPALRALSPIPSLFTGCVDPWLRSIAQDIAHATYPTEADLENYFVGYGALTQVAARQLLGSSPSDCEQTAVKLGSLMRATETLRDLDHDTKLGHLYIPLTTLDGWGVNHHRLTQPPTPEPVVLWVRQRCRSLIEEFDATIAKIPASQKMALRPLIVLSRLHTALLRQIQDSAQQTMPHQRISLKPLTALWHAWRAARSIKAPR